MITRGIVRRVLFAVALSLGLTGTAQAQLAWTVYSVGEFDTSDVVLALVGFSVGPARSGWAPVAGVSASWLQYPTGATTGDENRSVITVTPSVGVGNNFGTGSFGVRVGYAFSDADDDFVAPVAADVGADGIVNLVQLDYWGSGRLGAQAIASYNYGAESLWARGRVDHRIMSLGDDGQIRLGVEAALLNSTGYDATQIGGILGFHAGGGTIINLGVGRKLTDDGDDATYFRAELVLTPFR